MQQKKGVTLVPNAAVQRNTSSTFVYVVKPDQTVTIRPVTLGTTDANESEIVKGVATGDVVVTQGVDRLQEGHDRVRRSAARSVARTVQPGRRPAER